MKQRTQNIILKMKKEGKVQFKQFSDDILEAYESLLMKLYRILHLPMHMAKKVYDSYMNFKKNIYEWDSMAEKNYKV